LAIIFGAVLLAPLPSLADELATHQNTYVDDSPLYASNSSVLIELSIDGSDIQGSVWSDTSGWSTPATIFTDNGTTFDIEDVEVDELKNDTIVMSQGDDLITYSTDSGFEHFTQSSNVYRVIVSGNTASLIDYCDSGETTRSVTPWTNDGLGTTVELTGVTCTDDLAYFAGNRRVLIDYYSGIAYDVTDDYAVLDTIDLTGLGYVDEGDDFDSQGNSPDVARRHNGDIALAFEDQLYGFSYRDRAWRDIVTLTDGVIVPAENSAEYGYDPLLSPNEKSVLAFVSDDLDEATEYVVYRWTSPDGWIEDTTFSFTEPTTMFRSNLYDDSNIVSRHSVDKSLNTIDWVFWLHDSQTLQVYNWSSDDGYTLRTEHATTCDAECEFTVDISKRNKVFIVSSDPTGGSSHTVLAWKPVADVWEETNLARAGFVTTHVNNYGNFVVAFQSKSSPNQYSAKRWTSTNGWGTKAVLGADDVYFNNNHLYFTELNSSNELTTSSFRWRGRTSTVLDATSDVKLVDDSFSYGDYLFLLYASTSDEANTIAVEL